MTFSAIGPMLNFRYGIHGTEESDNAEYWGNFVIKVKI